MDNKLLQTLQVIFIFLDLLMVNLAFLVAQSISPEDPESGFTSGWNQSLLVRGDGL
ncbi:hypothetical protein BH24BAC1_BH24BAC1_27210 [soil metagenome]